ncbi:MAG: cytochrome c oxidase subunit 3 [bacterium]
MSSVRAGMDIGKDGAALAAAIDARGQAAHPNDDHAMHLPHGSWWPFWLALSIFLLGLGIMAVGQGLHMTPADGAAAVAEHRILHPSMPSMFALAVLGLGLLAVVGSLVGWFVQDYHWWDSKTGTGTTIPRAGTLLFISSEVFLFGALFANYFTFKASHPTFWPDITTEGGEAFSLPVLKTFIFSIFLFSSSYTVHQAEKHLLAGRHRKFVNWWGLTILLGLVFLGGQVNEYMNLIREGHTLGSSQFMTAFFILTGTHGLHVFGGLCILTVMWVRAMKGQFSSERHAGPQVAAMYWHFVDLVWVFVFGIIYLLNVHDWSKVLSF